MRKSLISLAIVCFNSIVCAQTSVTMGGGVDNAFARGTGSIANRNSIVSNAGGASKLWFTGREDLGGGHSANFWLDAAVNTDDGSGKSTSTNNQSSGLTTTGGLTFNRRSTVGLAGPWGEINLGRDHSAQYKGRYEIDPSGNNGVFTVQTQAGAISGPTGVRVSNFIGYALPANAGGFYGIAQYYLGENASNAGATAGDGHGAAARLGYVSGPLDVQAATAFTHFAQTSTTGPDPVVECHVALSTGRREADDGILP